MLHWPVATGFEDVVEADEVRLDISVWICDGISHTRLCCKVHHHGRVVLFEDPIDRWLVGNIALDEGVGNAFGYQTGEFV